MKNISKKTTVKKIKKLVDTNFRKCYIRKVVETNELVL